MRHNRTPFSDTKGCKMKLESDLSNGSVEESNGSRTWNPSNLSSLEGEQEVAAAAEAHGVKLRTIALFCLGGMMLGALLGVGHFFTSPPKYTATAVVTVSPSSTDVTDLNQLRWAQALARMAAMPEVSGDALRAVGRGDVADSPKSFVRSAAAPDAPVFSVSARMADAAAAQSTANAVATAAKQFSDRRNIPVRVVVTDASRPTQARPGLLVRVILGTTLGFVAGMTGSLLLRDRRLVQRTLQERQG